MQPQTPEVAGCAEEQEPDQAQPARSEPGPSVERAHSTGVQSKPPTRLPINDRSTCSSVTVCRPKPIPPTMCSPASASSSVNGGSDLGLTRRA